MQPLVKVFSKFIKMPFLLFYITAPDEVTAHDLGNAMVKQRLAACANYFPITSAYWWKTGLEQDNEWVILLKTRTDLGLALEAAIIQLHPYETPCVLRMEVRANAAYEAWITAETRDV